ncbi:MAG: ABC polyamine/opine transporter substrate-binding protein [Rhodomicrobium sp.]|nr:MAG: ABC polyamine/opine transporter substrate-binding protein [Rhodomicrobium sp.]
MRSSKRGMAIFGRSGILSGIVAGIAVIAVGGFAAAALAEANGNLKISTSAGAYQLSQKNAFFDPFNKKTGTSIDVETNNNPIEKLKSWKTASKAGMDVVNLTSHQAEVACREGLLRLLNSSDIETGPNVKDLSKDFLGDSLMDCAVPSVAWSSLMVVKHDAFKKKKPRTWRDFFNTKSYPGKRSMRQSARYTMEIALMSRRVKAQDVYSSLSTINGQKKAFQALDKLRDDIVWWDKSPQSIKNLMTDEVVMGVAYNGRLFDAIVKQSLDVTLIWQGQIYDFDYWGIPVKSGNQVEALEFVKFATAPEQLAQQSRWMPYGPMRKSSIDFVGNHELIDVHMSAYLPTTKAHFQRALKFNEGWWLSEDGQKLEERFKAWLDGKLEWPEKSD